MVAGKMRPHTGSLMDGTKIFSIKQLTSRKIFVIILTKLKEQCNLISSDEILSMLKELSNIDIGVKSGKIDISTGMFLFFEKL